MRLFVLPWISVLVLLFNFFKIFSSEMTEQIEELDEIARNGPGQLTTLRPTSREEVIPTEAAWFMNVLKSWVGCRGMRSCK